MIKDKSPQFSFQMICLEDYVPKDHLLRKIDRHIDFSFIRELTEDLYCADNGRPAVHPVSLFKMLFIGYLFGIRSERRLVQELEVNLAYRWFIGYDLDEGIYGVAGYRRPVHRGDGMFYPRGYRYDRGSDSYTCPGGQELTLSTIDRRGYRGYRYLYSSTG